MAFSPETISAIQTEATRLGLDWQVLAAVVQVESAGKAFIGGRCPIRIEGHYFYRLLPEEKRQAAMQQGLADPQAGKIANPSKMQDRYAMLARMCAMDEAAALQSCSWGLGQVMGAHWQALAYESPRQLADMAQQSVGLQVNLMGRFIAHEGLVPCLKAKQWEAFAAKYNGPNYVERQYHVQLEQAYEALLQHGPQAFAAQATHILEIGDQGEEVLSLQAALAEHCLYLAKLDGLFGPLTEAAVEAFQKAQGLPADGRAGPKTRALIFQEKT